MQPRHLLGLQLTLHCKAEIRHEQYRLIDSRCIHFLDEHVSEMIIVAGEQKLGNAALRPRLVARRCDADHVPQYAEDEVPRNELHRSNVYVAVDDA
jgi:hypothetical protein